MRTEKYILPAYWASALINGDYSGLDDDEQELVDDFLLATEGSCVDCSDESFFSWRHDASYLGVLAADCLEYTFLITDQ